MPGAKDILVRPISRDDANRIIRAFRYSGKVVNNSQLHFGVFLNGDCCGAMQFGPPLDRRKLIGLVAGTKWNDMLELNRMAFGDALPRNSESRALGVVFRIMRKAYPNLGWIVSFADAAQCGDGTIYRAAGFVLTGIRRNVHLWSNGVDVVSETTFTKGRHVNRTGGAASMSAFRDAGYSRMPGHQLRYIYFLDPNCRERLTVPVIAFAKIAEYGAGMYLGKPRVTGADSGTPADQAGGGGASPTVTLSSDSVENRHG